MASEISGFPTSLVLELAKMSRAIYPGPLNHKYLRLVGQAIEYQRYVHGSFKRGFCRIFANEKAVVVAFRGTRERVDWRIANLRALPVPLRDCGLRWPIFVHQGFQAALDFIDKTSGQRSLDAIFAILDQISVGTRELYVTGHSLGGAIAKLFVVKLRNARPTLVENNLRGVVTFGAPASGLAAFHELYGDLHQVTLRLVNAGDFVPFAPPIGYRHVGRSVWLRHSSFRDDPGWRLRLLYALSLVSPKENFLHHKMTEYIAGLNAVIGVAVERKAHPA